MKAAALLIGFLFSPAFGGTETPVDTPAAVFRDAKTEFLRLREKFLEGRIAERADARPLRVRQERLAPPHPGVAKAIAFVEEAAAGFNALRAGMQHVSRAGPTQEVNDLSRLFGLDMPEREHALQLYAALCWGQLKQSVSFDNGAQVFRGLDGKPLDEKGLARLLDAAAPTRGAARLDSAAAAAALKTLEERAAADLDAGALAALMDGSAGRTATVEAPAGAEPSGTGASGAWEIAGPARSGDADEKGRAKASADGAAANNEDASFSRAVLDGLPSLGAAASYFEPVPGTIARLSARAQASRLARALHSAPGGRTSPAARQTAQGLSRGNETVFADGAAVFVGMDGFLSFERPDGSAGWREGDGSAGVEVEAHQTILKWDRGADGGIYGVFRGTPFVAGRGTRFSLSPGRDALLLYDEDPGGRRRLAGIVAARQRLRCLDPLCAESMRWTASDGGDKTVLSLDVARLSDPSGLDPRGLPPSPDGAARWEAYGRMLKALPELIAGLDPAKATRSALVIDRRLHLTLRTPGGDADIMLEPSEQDGVPGISLYYERGSQRMILRCDAAVAVACGRYQPDAATAAESGRARWALSRSYARSGLGGGWTKGTPAAGVPRAWTRADEGWALFDGARATAGQLASPAAAVVQTVYHLGSGAAYAATASLSGSDAAESGWRRMMAAYCVADAPLVSGARRLAAWAGAAETPDPVRRYKGALASLSKGERAEVERLLDALVDREARRRHDLGEEEPPPEAARALVAAETFGQGNAARVLMESREGFEKALGLAMLAGETYGIGRYSGLLSEQVWARAAGAPASAVVARADSLAEIHAAWNAFDGGLGAAGHFSDLAGGAAAFVSSSLSGDQEAAEAAFVRAAQGLVGAGFFLKGRQDARRKAPEELASLSGASRPTAKSPPTILPFEETKLRLRGWLKEPEVQRAVASALGEVVARDLARGRGVASAAGICGELLQALDDVTIRLSQPGERVSMAFYHPNTKQIVISRKLVADGDYRSVAATLLHELVHAVRHHRGLEILGEMEAHGASGSLLRVLERTRFPELSEVDDADIRTSFLGANDPSVWVPFYFDPRRQPPGRRPQAINTVSEHYAARRYVEHADLPKRILKTAFLEAAAEEFGRDPGAGFTDVAARLRTRPRFISPGAEAAGAKSRRTTYLSDADILAIGRELQRGGAVDAAGASALARTENAAIHAAVSALREAGDLRWGRTTIHAPGLRGAAARAWAYFFGPDIDHY